MTKRRNGCPECYWGMVSCPMCCTGTYSNHEPKELIDDNFDEPDIDILIDQRKELDND